MVDKIQCVECGIHKEWYEYYPLKERGITEVCQECHIALALSGKEPPGTVHPVRFRELYNKYRRFDRNRIREERQRLVQEKKDYRSLIKPYRPVMSRVRSSMARYDGDIHHWSDIPHLYQVARSLGEPPKDMVDPEIDHIFPVSVFDPEAAYSSVILFSVMNHRWLSRADNLARNHTGEYGLARLILQSYEIDTIDYLERLVKYYGSKNLPPLLFDDFKLMFNPIRRPGLWPITSLLTSK